MTPNIEKNDLMELEILKHVENTPKLNNRMAAAKLGCSVKLAHSLLGRMVEKGWLHVRKIHSRRWDYFLTPSGVSEKARLTYEFLDFSMRFYHEARKKSSQVCRDLARDGGKTVAFIGAGELAEIAYLGVKEWNLELIEVYDDAKSEFLGRPVRPFADFAESEADAAILCAYDASHPKAGGDLPPGIRPTAKIHHIFTATTQL